MKRPIFMFALIICIPLTSIIFGIVMWTLATPFDQLPSDKTAQTDQTIPGDRAKPDPSRAPLSKTSWRQQP